MGLLAVLLVNSFFKALELARQSAAIFQGQTMVVLAAAASFLLFMAVGRRRSAARVTLFTFIALGIGMHNLGEASRSEPHSLPVLRALITS